MRYGRSSLVIGAVVALAFSTFAVAGALITGSDGQVVWLSSPPASVAVNVTEDATSAIAFDEQQAVTLTAPLLVDAVDPGTYSKFPSGNRKVAAGTQVDSHMVHSDPPSGGSLRRTGSVTFATEILGVIGATARLAPSDAPVGAPGTTYAGTRTYRGLEKDGTVPSADSITISADRRTVSFDVRTTTVIDEFRVLTRHVDSLATAIVDTPDPVTAGNDLQYTLVVTNTGYLPAANAHVVDTLPAGTTVVTTSAPGGCSVAATVDCSLGTIGVGASAVATIVVTTPAAVPAGGSLTNRAIASPGAGNVEAVETTAVIEPSPEESRGFVIPGGSIDIGGDAPAAVDLPETGDGAPVIITQGPGTFCNGPCTGTVTTISPFPGYSDPLNPIHVTLTYLFPEGGTFPEGDSLTAAAAAYGSTIFKNTDPDHPEVGSVVPFCANLGSGVADPHPCVDGRAITQPTPNSFVVTFEIVYLSGDPSYGRR